MRTSKAWFWTVFWAGATFVVVSTIVSAARQGSWAPVEEMSWFPAVLLAVTGRGYRGCGIRIR